MAIRASAKPAANSSVPVWRSARMWRWLNLALAIGWLIVVPVSLLTGWIYSVAFISAVSIYANFVTHIAGWRADEPVETEEPADTRSAVSALSGAATITQPAPVAESD
jgi:hypothetical protein